MNHLESICVCEWVEKEELAACMFAEWELVKCVLATCVLDSWEFAIWLLAKWALFICAFTIRALEMLLAAWELAMCELVV